MERYQKQFKFLCENDIETVEQLAVFRKSAEDDILKLTAERQMLYDKPDGEKDIRDINLQLSELRKKVKLCKDIVEDSKRIQEKHPDIHYHILSGNAAFVQEHLDRGLIDFGVVYSPVDTNVYSSIQVPIRDTWGVLMRKDAPLAQKALIQPQDLWDQPLILSAQKQMLGRCPTGLGRILPN